MRSIRREDQGPTPSRLFVMAACLVVGFMGPRMMAEEPPSRVNVSVLVKDASTDQPIQYAHLTLQFRELGDPSKLRRTKMISYSAKTNPHGRYKFTGIPKGTIRLQVTAERHQAFGQEFEIDKDGQVIEVKLRKPQPLL